VNKYNSNLTQNFKIFKPYNGSQISIKIFTNFGLKEYPESGIPWGLFDYHMLNGKSLAERISGKENIEEVDEIKKKYTEDAPQ